MALTRITKGVIKPNENYDTHNINSTGIITAIGFKGPFTGSSNIQSGIVTATQLDLNGNGDISGNLNVGGTLDVDGHTELDNVNVAGVITATEFKGGDFDGRNLNISGIATFAGNVSIAGTLTYEDVTNVDAVGLVTARTGVVSPYADIDDWIDVGNNIQLGNAGIVTAKGADINGDIDVDGHTNLDNVSIAGVTTAAGNIIANSKIGIGTDSPIGTLDIFNANADASNTNSLGAQINAAWIRIGDVDAAGKTFSNGLGTKLYNQGTAHWSYGMLGQDFLITNTSGDGARLFPSNRTAPFIIKSDGKVGIGSETPGRPLTLTYTDPRIRLQNSANGGHAEIYTDNDNHLYLTADSSASGGGSRIVFQTDGANERARIDNNGNFIFYNSTTAWNKIQRANAAHYAGIAIQESDATQRMQFGVSGGTNQIVTGSAQHDVCLKAYDANLILATNATEKLRITSSGQVLIGINNAVDAEVDLQIHSATSGNGPILNMTNNTGDCRIFFGQDNSSGSANAQGQLRYNVASNYLTLYTAGDERLRIASSGSVGINTTLTHAGGGNKMLNIAAASQSYSGTSDLMDGGGICFQPTDTLPSTGRSYPGIFWSGNTSSLSRARAGIVGVAAANNDATDLVFLTRYMADGSTMTSADEQMRITSGGYLGLGTNNPDTFAHFKGTGNTNVTLTLEQGTTAGNVSGIKVGRTDGSGNVRMTTAVGGGIPVSGVPGIMFGSTDTNLPAIGFQTPNSSNGHIVFSPKGSERVRITSDGKVLLKKTSSNWGTTASNTVIQLENSAIWDYAGVQFDVGHNYYYNSSGAYKYIRGGYACRQTFHNNTGDIAFWSGGTGSADATFTWAERLRIESGGRVNFSTDNNDYSNPDIGGSCAGISLNKNTAGQIYACVDDNQGHYYRNWTMNLCRRNNAGDGPQLALDRSGWVKASIGGLSGSNTANGGPGMFAVWTHDYNSGSHVQKEQLKITNSGQWYIGRDGVGARLYTDGSSGSMYLQSGNGRQTFRIYDMASGQSHTTHLDATGQLGIGIAPADKLHIYHATNDPFIKIQRDTSSNVSIGGIKFASGAGSGIFATMGARVTSNSGEKGCVYIQTQDGSNTREPLRAVGASGGQGSRLTSQGNSVCVFGSDQTHGGQFIDGRPNSNNVYEYSWGGYRNNANGMYGGTFVVTGTGGSAATTWYPVWFSLHTKFPQVLTIGKYVHNYGSWDGQFLFRADISGTGYGAYGALHRVTHHTTSAKNFIGRIVFTSHNNAYLVLWMLGGGRSYHWGTIGGGVQSISVGDDGNNHNLGPGNSSEGPITSADTMDYGYEPNMNDSPSHQQTGFT